MAAFNFRRRQTRRWWYVGATLVAAALCMTFFVVGASALTGSPSKFESQDALNNANPPVPDGNMTVDVSGNSDWNCFAGHDGFHSPASDITIGQTCSSSLNVSAGFTATDPAATTSDDSWVNGTKFDNACEPQGTNKNPGKDDFINIASYSEVRSSDKHQFLYGATIRYTANGSASENVELNQVAGNASCPILRTAGDHLLAFDYNSGGKVLDLHVLTWIDNTVPGTTDKLGGNNGICIISKDSMPCWGANVITPGQASFDGDTNASAIPKEKNAISYADLVAGQFAEFGVDLTTALNQDVNACNTTSQIDWESRSSGSSFSSNPEDIHIDTHPISNCGRIIIHKQTSPRGIDQAFAFNSDIPNPTGTVTTSSSPYCQGDTTPNGTAGFSLNDKNNANKATSVNDAANTEDCQNVVQNTYHVTEQTVAGFTLSNIVCSTPTGGSSTVTYGAASHSSFTAGDTVANISLKPNETVECTYTNHQNTSSLSTQASSTGSVTPGTGVYDTATVTGDSANGSSPTGSVTFYLCSGTTGCTSSGTKLTPDSALTTVSGITETATSPTVNGSGSELQPGDYCFAAYWGGDTNYPAANSTTATNECFTVAKINTNTVTQTNDGSGVSKSTITLGGSITDTATVTGTSVGGDPGGNVEFFLCSQATSCSSGGVSQGTVGLTSDGNSATFTSTASKTVTPTAIGSYCFRAEYKGSTVYNTSTDNGANECFTVTDSTSEASTQSWVPNDSATVTAAHGSPLNGELKIQLYTGTGCVAANADATHVYTKTLTNATSAADRTLTTTNQDVFNSSISWKVTFTSSNSNVDTSGATSHCESSTLTVNN